MGAYDSLSIENRRKADSLLATTAANNGLAPVDLTRFWQDQETARADPFGPKIPQAAFGAHCTWECIFDELGIEQDWQRFLYDDIPWALEISRRYNDLAERIVGRRLVSEQIPGSTRSWPDVKMLHDLFEAKNVWEGGKSGSWWLKMAVDNPTDLARLLDRVESRLPHIKEFMLPVNWDSEKSRLKALGVPLPLYRWQRGPCTFATSVYGAENLLMLYYDNRELFIRFSDLIGRSIVAIAGVIDAEAGYNAENAPKGWGWADDNSCLFNVKAYELFAMPVHRRVFAVYAPSPNDRRYQHSDSNMAHLLPVMSTLNLTGTNFGPTLSFTQIRGHFPNAVIDGQLAPFTYCRNEEANMVAEFLRDFDQAKETRGLNFTASGSVNNGSRLSGMRLLMAAVQQYGGYD